jgi:iron(III) transport system ATP-binding protein
MAELRCVGVRKSYAERYVLSGLDLVVPEGTLTAILGASGSGKTTLLRVIMGFLRLDEGTIEIGGTRVAEASGTHLAPEKRTVGYVAQEGALYPHLNVAENVSFGLPRAERKGRGREGLRRVDEVLDLVGLGSGYARRRVHELSGGEQRRVALARALAPRPRLVLLDEPFSGLDAALRADTRQAVHRALTEEKTTAVLVTHDQAEALSMGREVAVLRDGCLVQTAAPADLYRVPRDVEVARFVGEAVVLPGEIRSGHVNCALGDLPFTDNAAGRAQGAVQVVVRPEQIRMCRRSAAIDASERSGWALHATVVGHSYYGSEVLVRLSLEGCEGVVVSAKAFGHDAPKDGETVALQVSGPVLVYAAPGS